MSYRLDVFNHEKEKLIQILRAEINDIKRILEISSSNISRLLDQMNDKTRLLNELSGIPVKFEDLK